MTTKFFKGVKNISELRATYKELIKKYHPDCGGDLETMQEINAEYDALFAKLPKDAPQGDTAETQTAANGDGVTDAMRAVLERLASLDGIKIEICGSWVWVSGATYPVKDAIKAAGCFFSRKKSMWYWRAAESGHYHKRGGASMEQIREKYGSESYTGTAQKELA